MSSHFDGFDPISLDELELAAGGCYHPENQPIQNTQINNVGNGNLSLTQPIHSDWGGITGGFPLEGLGGPLGDLPPAGLNGYPQPSVPAGLTGMPLIHGNGLTTTLPFAPQQTAEPTIHHFAVFRAVHFTPR